MTTPIRCIIVDDEPAAHYVLSDYIDKNPFLSLEHQMYNGLEVIKYFENHSVDLMFLDIDMPEITGIELLRILPNKPRTILTTAYSEFALESYEYGVIDYLLKPIFYPRFLKAIAHFQEKSQNAKQVVKEEIPKDITLKVGSETATISLSDILYTKSYGNYVKVFTKRRSYIATITTTELLKQLPAEIFVRAHKSYIVSLEKISRLENDTIYINHSTIPIGITYKRELLEKVNTLDS